MMLFVTDIVANNKSVYLGPRNTICTHSQTRKTPMTATGNEKIIHEAKVIVELPPSSLGY